MHGNPACCNHVVELGANPSIPSSAAPSHDQQGSDPMADSPTPSADSLGGPLRAIQPGQDNAVNTLVNMTTVPPPPPVVPISVTVTALPMPAEDASPLGTRSSKGGRLAARATDENMPMHRIAYVLPYCDNNVNGVDDGYRCSPRVLPLYTLRKRCYWLCVLSSNKHTHHNHHADVQHPHRTLCVRTRWRKYGRKMVAGQNYQRHYFKCSNSTCAARRHTECYPPDPSKIQVTYEPTPHNHPPPFVQAAEHFAQLLKQGWSLLLGF